MTGSIVQPGTSTFLIGDSGTGKTHSIRTFIEAGITPFVISTEPGIASTLGDIPSDKLHWKYISPMKVSWASMKASFNQVNTLDAKSLANLGGADRAKYRQFMEVVTTCNNFICDRTGESFGDIETWSNDRVLVVDSLSGLNIMAMKLVIGSKPTAGKGDWGVAMQNLEGFLMKMITDLQCWYVLTGHLDRETDEISGTTQIMAASLGKKLAPKLPLFFDDVIRPLRKGAVFTWSTIAANTILKTRNLEFSNELPPSFLPIVAKWKTEGGVIVPTETQEQK